VLDTIRELRIGFVAYSPLGRGFLTGRIRSPEDLPEDDARRSGYFPRFVRENFRHNLDLVERVKQIADEKGVAPGQLALAWVMAQGTDIVPIPGTRHASYLEQNVAAARVGLTDDERARIDAVAPLGASAGDRYADMSGVHR
jgi:aryl-alcohol dehydrogenase-like predicted oxidoreductase